MANRKYSEEFKEEAIELLRRSDATMKQVAEQLGVNYWTLREWRIQAEEGGKRVSEGEQEELKRLRRENRRLKQEQEILKKAVAFFAKENK